MMNQVIGIATRPIKTVELLGVQVIFGKLYQSFDYPVWLGWSSGDVYHWKTIGTFPVGSEQAARVFALVLKTGSLSGV